MYESWTIYDTGEQTKTKRPWLEYCVSRVLLCELQRLMLRVTLFPEINTSSGYVAGLNVFVEYHRTRTKKTEAKVKAIAKWAGTLLNTPWTIKGTKKQTKDTPRRLQKLINDVCLQPGLLSHSMLLVMYIPGLIRFKQTEMERVETNYLFPIGWAVENNTASKEELETPRNLPCIQEKVGTNQPKKRSATS